MDIVARKYIETFNELDPAKRRTLIDAVFAEDCRYTDPHADVRGRDGIEEFIRSARARMPAAVFALKGAVDNHHDQARFQWTVARERGQEPLAIGFDAIVLENGRIKRVYGFIDRGRAEALREAVAVYLAAWNERDEPKRRALLARVYAPDATYTDPLASASGLAELSGLIGHVQKEYPGMVLSAGDAFDTHHDQVRFTWVAKLEGHAEPAIVGFDIAAFEGDKMRTVLGFIDRAPPAK